MVTTKHCSHGTCKNDSRYPHQFSSPGISFFRFPNKKYFPRKCARWVKACSRVGFSVNNVTRFMYICSEHFIGGKGPTPEDPHPIRASCSSQVLAKFSNPRRVLTKVLKPSSKESTPTLTSQIESNHSIQGTIIVPSTSTTYSKQDNVINATFRTHASVPTEDEPLGMHSCLDMDFITPEADGAQNQTFDISNEPSSQLISEDELPYSLFISPKKSNEKPFKMFPISLELKTILKEGWKIGLSEYDPDTYTFTRMDGKTTDEVQLDTDTGHYSLTVEGHSLCIDDAQDFPKFVTCHEDLCLLLGLLKNYQRCIGFSTTKCQRSDACTILIIDPNLSKCTRCMSCASEFDLVKKREKYRNITSPKKISKMTPGKLKRVISIEKCKRRFMEQKLKRCTKKLENLFETSGSTEAKKPAEHPEASATQDLAQLMIRQQIKAASVDRHGMRWHPEVIKWAAYLRSKSPSAYEEILKSGFLRLPSASTLRNSFVTFNHKSGFHDETLTEMCEIVGMSTMEDWKKYVVLSIDEMKIREDIVYNKRSGEIVGFIHENDCNSAKVLGDCKEKMPEVATHMLALFVRGAATNFKYAYAHFPSRNLTWEQISDIVWDGIKNLEKIGFRVIAVVSDGAKANRKFFKHNADDPNLSYKTLNIYALDEPRYIWFICDVPHLLKTTRNCLLSSYTGSKTRYLRRRNKDVSWSHITRAYNNSTVSQYRILWKLTKAHVHVTPLSKMNVRLAAQVLSARTAAAVQILVGEQASETVAFLKLFNDWFDCVNGHQLGLDRMQRNPNVAPYTSPDDPRLQWLKTHFMSELDAWKAEVDNLKDLSDEQRNKMFLSRETYEGHRITVHSMTEVIPFLLSKGVRYVFPSHFNQDVLEQEFSRQRASRGRADNPSVEEFGYNTRKLNAARQYVATRKGNTMICT